MAVGSVNTKTHQLKSSCFCENFNGGNVKLEKCYLLTVILLIEKDATFSTLTSRYGKFNQENMYQTLPDFTPRIVNTWNSLSDYVVNVDSVEVFKKRLDKFWSNQPVKFDCRASLTGTGDGSEFLVE